MATPLSAWAREYLGAQHATFLETADECLCAQQVGENEFVCWHIIREDADTITARQIARELDAIEVVRLAFEHAAEWSRKGARP